MALHELPLHGHHDEAAHRQPILSPHRYSDPHQHNSLHIGEEQRWPILPLPTQRSSEKGKEDAYEAYERQNVGQGHTLHFTEPFRSTDVQQAAPLKGKRPVDMNALPRARVGPPQHLEEKWKLPKHLRRGNEPVQYLTMEIAQALVRKAQEENSVVCKDLGGFRYFATSSGDIYDLPIDKAIKEKSQVEEQINIFKMRPPDPRAGERFGQALKYIEIGRSNTSRKKAVFQAQREALRVAHSRSLFNVSPTFLPSPNEAASSQLPRHEAHVTRKKQLHAAAPLSLHPPLAVSTHHDPDIHQQSVIRDKNEHGSFQPSFHMSTVHESGNDGAIAQQIESQAQEAHTRAPNALTNVK